MTVQSFAGAMPLILAHEGLYSNNPKDPGGATMKGVTQAVYNHYRQNKGQAVQSVKLISDDELYEIYHLQYYDAIQGDRLPAGVDYAVFDFAVNSGPSQAVKELQRVLDVAVDGQVGEATINAAIAATSTVTGAVSVIEKYCDLRMSFLKSLKTWGTFGAGWDRRVEGNTAEYQDGDNGVVDYAVNMAKVQAGHVVDALPPPAPIGQYAGEVNGKGLPQDQAVSKTPQGKGLIATVTGVGGTAVATATQLLNNNVQPAVDVATKASQTATQASGAIVQIHGATHRVFHLFPPVVLECVLGGSAVLAVAGCAWFAWHYMQAQREKASAA